MCNSKSILNPQKRDYLLLHKKQELTKIMKENGKLKTFICVDINFSLGSFISFSTFGSEENDIQVYAENNINVDRTLRSLNYLVRNTMCLHTHSIYLFYLPLDKSCISSHYSAFSVTTKRCHVPFNEKLECSSHV